MSMKAIPVFLAALILLALLLFGAGQANNPNTEPALGPAWTDGMVQPADRPAEKAMRNLYEKGIGDAWAGGSPFSSGTEAGEIEAKSKACPVVNYQLIGFLNVTSGIIIATDSGSSMRLTPDAGIYPVYGYFDADKMTGIFIDFNSTVVA